MKRMYTPKHVLPEEAAPKKPEKRKRAQVVYLCLIAAYLAAVAGITAYGQLTLPGRLPKVTIGRIEKGRVPSSALMGNEETGYILNTLDQTDGPWGKRYVVRQILTANYGKVDEDTVFIYEAISLEQPVILSSDAEFLYEGMEVQIGP